MNPSSDPLRTENKSPSQIDLLRETQLQSSIFQAGSAPHYRLDFHRLRQRLDNERHIPAPIAEKALLRIQDNLDRLGVGQPSATLVVHWLTELLREEGYSLGETALQSLELSLSDVETLIHHPLGYGAGANQNPEATALRIAQGVKSQFAAKSVFEGDVIDAHEGGRIELMHLGAVDRPHDVFLTPDYLKTHGLPIISGAPHAGPAKRADVLLAHMVRFTHELQNHFAGDIQWGYANTLLTPFLTDLNEQDLRQFVQQMLFEFAQLEVERGGLYRKVTLDFDFDLPRQLTGLPALGPGGEDSGRAYDAYRKTLRRFNEVALDILERGDYRKNPFQNPRIVFHFNDPKTSWNNLTQRLMSAAFKWGNPSLAFSYFSRDFGPLGRISLNDPDFLKTIQQPRQLRGFSSSSVAINLPRLAHPDGDGDFDQRLAQGFGLIVEAHRQKRLFLSRLMAYGNRGPLQFLRHKIGGQPFLKIDQATQPLQAIGLGEAAALGNGSPVSDPVALVAESETILRALNQTLTLNNRLHKLRMFLSGARNDSVAYRFAHLDMRLFGQSYSPYLFHGAEQAHPIYTEGPNILAFTNIGWRERFVIEGRLHAHFGGRHELTAFIRNGAPEDPALCHMVYQEAQTAKISQLQMAPDLGICMDCFFVFNRRERDGEACPHCESRLVSAYGYCQGNFSPVHTWCLGKRAEWKIRKRIDERHHPVQTQFTW